VNFQKICVIGLGYIGLPTASTFAAHGVNVLGVDINSHIIEIINKGEIHIHEPGLLEEVQKRFTRETSKLPPVRKKRTPSSSPYQPHFRKINSANITA